MEQSQWQRQAAQYSGFDAHGRELEAAKVRPCRGVWVMELD